MVRILILQQPRDGFEQSPEPMRTLADLPQLIDQGTPIAAIESPVTERRFVLQRLFSWTQQRDLSLFFWNPGYASVQRVTFKAAAPPAGAESPHMSPAHPVPEEGVLPCLMHQGKRGVYVLEGLVDQGEGLLTRRGHYQLMNAYYEISTLDHRQHWILLGDVIQLPSQLVPLIPLLTNPLPHGDRLQQWLQTFLDTHSPYAVEPDDVLALTKACLGLPWGELEVVLGRSLPQVQTPAELVEKLVTHKITKLRGRGLEFIAQPDVPAGGLDLLEHLLDRAAALLSLDAPHHGLAFPKGIILWGPPGTGKSLSAKHAAKKMGVPLIAADWGGLLSHVPGESEANLRFLLEIVEVTSPCILYWDDFDKAFAGWNSDTGGGVQRRLAGKLLTWMQERTAPVFVIATVNRLEMLPAELNRRFDDIVFVDLPHAGARKEIFDIHLGQYAPGLCDPDSGLSDSQWRHLLQEYNLCTAAEIGLAVRKAAEEAFFQNRPGQITLADLLYQRQQFTPAMVREEEQLLAIRKRAHNARPASSPDTSKWQTQPAELFEFLRSR